MSEDNIVDVFTVRLVNGNCEVKLQHKSMPILLFGLKMLEMVIENSILQKQAQSEHGGEPTVKVVPSGILNKMNDELFQKLRRGNGK